MAVLAQMLRDKGISQKAIAKDFKKSKQHISILLAALKDVSGEANEAWAEGMPFDLVRRISHWTRAQQDEAVKTFKTLGRKGLDAPPNSRKEVP
jgi:hypothetical protein